MTRRIAAVAVWWFAVAGSPALAVETTVGGVDLSATGYVEVRQGIEVQDTPDDRNFQELWLHLRARVNQHISFDTTFATRNGGPTTEANHAGFNRWDAVFQSVAPALEFEEALIRLRFDQIDLRIGKQKIAWGKLDRTQPTDLLNTEKYNDPFLRAEDQNKIGVPAVNGSYYPTAAWLPEEARLNLVWIPWYHPYRFPLIGERWFPPAAVPRDTFPARTGFITFPDQTPVPVPEDGFPLDHLTPNVAPPSFSLQNSGYAVRASGLTAGIDYAVMYYHGVDMQPAFDLTAKLVSAPGVYPGTTYQNFMAATELRPTFHTIDACGGDAAYSWGRFTFRGEGAFIHGRPLSKDIRYLINDLSALSALQVPVQNAANEIWAGADTAQIALPEKSFVVRDVVEWGVGADTTLGGYTFLLQLNQTNVLDNGDDLLIEDVETRLLGSIRRSFLQDDLLLQLQAVYGASSDYTMLLPGITYRIWRGLEGQVGYLYIAGSKNSVGGQFKKNDEAVLTLRYVF